jgi:type VI secretion system protein ImpG
MLHPGSLRFHIGLTPLQNAAALYELLFSGVVDVAIARSPEDRDPVILGAKAIKPVGFDRDEALLPHGPRSFQGYRLLTEYFAFPRKFLFFDLTGLTPDAWAKFSNRAGIYIYFGPENEELGRLVSPETLRMGCTPIVNLFTQRADPIAVTQRQTEYRVVPDARRDSAMEVHSIERVSASSPDGQVVEYVPFYSTRHADGTADVEMFWHSARRGRTLAQSGGSQTQPDGTDVYLTLVDLDFSPSLPANCTLHVETNCVNRDVPNSLAVQEGRIRFRLPEGHGPVSDVICLGTPTATRRPEPKRLLLWQVISHLSLNHLSLDDQANAGALKEMLKLYDVVGSADSRDMIDGISDLQCRRGVARVGGTAGGFCRGLDVSLLLDEGKFTGSGAYLFASVLSHFFGLYVSVNSFARVKVTTLRKRSKGEAWTWAPRAGERQLL